MTHPNDIAWIFLNLIEKMLFGDSYWNPKNTGIVTCYFSAGIYLLKVNNRNTTLKGSGVFIVNFEHILQIDLVFVLLTLNM